MGGKPVSARCLARLHERQLTGEIEIVGVICRPKGHIGWWSAPDVPEMFDTADALGLPIVEHERIAELDADLGISLLYHRIFPEEAIRSFRSGILNFHPAPLPHYRGANSVSHALIDGADRFGASLHFVNAGVDKGDIVEVRWIDVSPEMSARDLTLQVERIIESMFVDWLERMIDDDLPAESQAAICERDGIRPRYHARTSLEGVREVALDWPAERLWNHVRALDFPPFEPAFAYVGGRKVYLRVTR